MYLDVEKYRRAFHPTNLFELLPRPIIEQMIRGFFYRIKKGVTLLWSEYDVANRRWVVLDDRLDPFDYDSPDDRQFYNELCWEYRLRCGSNDCQACDQLVAQDYVDGRRSSVELYPCWLGLDDSAYPLRIGGLVRGILFGGQIVPNDALRIQQIEANIRRNVEASLVDALIELLHKERQRQREGESEYGRSHLTRLRAFGDMMQEILTRLYEARKDAATRELLQSSEDILASADLGDVNAWWSTCQRLVDAFAELVEMDIVCA